MLNEKRFINYKCEACGRVIGHSIKRFSGMRLCTHCFEMLSPTDVHYGHFML